MHEDFRKDRSVEPQLVNTMCANKSGRKNNQLRAKHTSFAQSLPREVRSPQEPLMLRPFPGKLAPCFIHDSIMLVALLGD
jgi:hypothetical protein